MATSDSRSGDRANPAGHTPMVSDEHAERIRRWHDNAYQAAKAAAGQASQTFTYLGRTLVVPPEVQPITGMSHLLGEASQDLTKDGWRVDYFTFLLTP